MAAVQEGAAMGFEKTLVGQILRATALGFPTSRSEDSGLSGMMSARDAPAAQQGLNQPSPPPQPHHQSQQQNQHLHQNQPHHQPQPQPQHQNQLPQHQHQTQPQPQHQPQHQHPNQHQHQHQPQNQNQHQNQQRTSQGNPMEAQERTDLAINRSATRPGPEAAAASSPQVPRGLHLPGQPIPERHVAPGVVHLFRTVKQGPKLELPRIGSSISLQVETPSPGSTPLPVPTQQPEAADAASPGTASPAAPPPAKEGAAADASPPSKGPGLAPAADVESPSKPTSKPTTRKVDSSPSKVASGSPAASSAAVGGSAAAAAAADGTGAKGEGPSWKRLEGWQIDYLERCFLGGELEVDRERREQLAAELKVKPRQVAVWFQNRRGRHTLESRESEVNELRKSLADLQQQYAELRQCHVALAASSPHCGHTPSCPCHMGVLHRTASGARSSITNASAQQEQQQQQQQLGPDMRQLMVQAGAVSDDEEVPTLQKTLSTESSCRRQGSFNVAAPRQHQQHQHMMGPTPLLTGPAGSDATAITPITRTSSGVNSALPTAQQMPLSPATAASAQAANSPAVQALSAILAAAAAMSAPAQALPSRPQGESKAKLASTLQLISSYLTQAMTQGKTNSPPQAQGQQQQQQQGQQHLHQQQQQEHQQQHHYHHEQEQALGGQPRRGGQKRLRFEENDERPGKIVRVSDAAPVQAAPLPQQQLPSHPVNPELAVAATQCPVHPDSDPAHGENSPDASHHSTVEEDENAYLSGATSSGNDGGILAVDAEALPPPLAIPKAKSIRGPLGAGDDGQQDMNSCFQWLLAGSPTGLSPLCSKPCGHSFPGSSPLGHWSSAPDLARKDINSWPAPVNANLEKNDSKAQKGLGAEEGCQGGLMDPGYIDQTGDCAQLWESAL